MKNKLIPIIILLVLGGVGFYVLNINKGSQKILYIDSKKSDCVGVSKRKCFLVRETPDEEWQLFYNSIEGFNYEPGFTYKLLVETRKVSNPPADGSSLRWILKDVLEKSK